MNKINWAGIWASFKVLKRLLSNRVKGEDNKFWIQSPPGNPGIFNRVDFILDHCRGKRVLHIGCTDHPFTRKKIENCSLLHTLLKSVSKELKGIDNDQPSIDEYTLLTGDSNIYNCDITDHYPGTILPDETDVVVLSEVLEHLKDPSKAIDLLHGHFNSGTEVLVTVPNYASVSSIAASLNSKELIHPDHYWYFSPYTLSRLFENGFALKALHFGMYYQRGTRINRVMKKFRYNADCIIAVFEVKK